MKQFLKRGAAALIALGVLVNLAACSAPARQKNLQNTPAISYYNYKPEADASLRALASEYTKKTGIDVTITTVDNGKYDEKLQSAFTKPAPPTIFHVSSIQGVKRWRDYVSPLQGTSIYHDLENKSSALSRSGDVVAIPYTSEAYGIVYNKAILQRYFALPNPLVHSVEEIRDFDTLQRVCDDIQAHRAQLGIDATFATPAMSASSIWRFSKHMVNYALTCDLASGTSSTLAGNCLPGLHALFDLYLRDSLAITTNASDYQDADNLVPLTQVSLDDAMGQFVSGKVAMIQQGTWSWAQLKALGMSEENVGMMPIRMNGIEQKGYAIGSEDYWCINLQASKIDQKASIDFLHWLSTSQQAQKVLVDELGWSMPFGGSEQQHSTNPLSEQVRLSLGEESLEKAATPGSGTGLGTQDDSQGDTDNSTSTAVKKKPVPAPASRETQQESNEVPWLFALAPDSRFADSMGQALSQYAQDFASGKQANWQAVVKAYVNSWAQASADTDDED